MTPEIYKGWAIVSPWKKPWIMGFSTSFTRKDAIEKFIDNNRVWYPTWRQAYRKGFRCIMVKVIPAGGDAP